MSKTPNLKINLAQSKDSIQIKPIAFVDDSFTHSLILASKRSKTPVCLWIIDR